MVIKILIISYIFLTRNHLETRLVADALELPVNYTIFNKIKQKLKMHYAATPK